MTYISKCDLIVYDLHSGNPEDVYLALDAMNKPRPDDDPGQEKIIILISSLLAWDATPRNLEQVLSPQEIEEEEKAQAEAEAKAAAEAEAERKKLEGGDAGEEGANGEEGSEKEEAASEVASPKEGEGEEKAEGEGGEDQVLSQQEEEKEEVPPPEPVRKRKRFLHHPFTEQDYLKRKASHDYAKIKEVEDKVLNFKKENVKTYVISAGVLYGLGEAIFNHHFERAWKQNPEKLPIIGEGKNYVPTIHVKDLARMVKKISEAPPEQHYIFGIDNTKKPTQKKLIQAISDGIGTGLVESVDIPLEYAPVHPKQTPLNLNLDWKRFVMLNIKAKPSKIFVPETEGAGEGEEEEAEGGDDGGFQWHCKGGLSANIQRVKEEFCKDRGLKPFKIAVSGKPCSGKSYFAAQLAKHYDIPHIHKEQVLHDIQNWNKEKEAIYKFA
jgi:adenylate kinase